KQIWEYHISLVPQLINGKQVLSLFVNQPMTCELSLRYHRVGCNGTTIAVKCGTLWELTGSVTNSYTSILNLADSGREMTISHEAHVSSTDGKIGMRKCPSVISAERSAKRYSDQPRNLKRFIGSD